MTGREMKNLRKRMMLSARELGEKLGYGGDPDNISRQIRKYEARTEVPEGVADRVYALAYAMGVIRNVKIREL